MRILILPSWYPTKNDTVRGSFFAEQAEALARAGHSVSVFAVFSSRSIPCRVEKSRRGEVTEYAISVKRIPCHLTFFRIMNAMIKLLRAMPKEERPEIIHVHSFYSARYARALKALFGLPYVVTEHVTWFERKLLSEKQLRFVSWSYAAADAIVAVSPGLRQQIRPYCGGKEIAVIPNLVSERFFSGELHAQAGESIGFVSVGMLDYKKGFDLLLRAFAAAAERTERQLTLTVCGDGVERSALEALAEELGIREKVTFAGNVSREEVASTLRRNQIFVLPSRTETFGVVYVEAMACGLPIIMTKTNAWELLAMPETGIAVDVEDVPALTDAMVTVLENYDSYDPARIAAICAERFSESAVTGQLTALYRRVLEG